MARDASPLDRRPTQRSVLGALIVLISTSAVFADPPNAVRSTGAVDALKHALSKPPESLAELTGHDFASIPLTKTDAATARDLVWKAYAAQVERERAAEVRDRKLIDGELEMPFFLTTFGEKPKEGHSLWLQIAAELGLPALAFLILFYGQCLLRLWSLRKASAQPVFFSYAHMVIASLIGFAVSAQFISLWALEIPYYTVLVGAGALKSPRFAFAFPLELTFESVPPQPLSPISHPPPAACRAPSCFAAMRAAKCSISPRKRRPKMRSS